MCELNKFFSPLSTPAETNLTLQNGIKYYSFQDDDQENQKKQRNPIEGKMFKQNIIEWLRTLKQSEKLKEVFSFTSLLKVTQILYMFQKVNENVRSGYLFKDVHKELNPSLYQSIQPQYIKEETHFISSLCDQDVKKSYQPVQDNLPAKWQTLQKKFLNCIQVIDLETTCDTICVSCEKLNKLEDFLKLIDELSNYKIFDQLPKIQTVDAKPQVVYSNVWCKNEYLPLYKWILIELERAVITRYLEKTEKVKLTIDVRLVKLPYLKDYLNKKPKDYLKGIMDKSGDEYFQFLNYNKTQHNIAQQILQEPQQQNEIFQKVSDDMIINVHVQNFYSITNTQFLFSSEEDKSKQEAFDKLSFQHLIYSQLSDIGSHKYFIRKRYFHKLLKMYEKETYEDLINESKSQKKQKKQLTETNNDEDDLTQYSQGFVRDVINKIITGDNQPTNINQEVLKPQQKQLKANKKKNKKNKNIYVAKTPIIEQQEILNEKNVELGEKQHSVIFTFQILNKFATATTANINSDEDQITCLEELRYKDTDEFMVLEPRKQYPRRKQYNQGTDRAVQCNPTYSDKKVGPEERMKSQKVFNLQKNIHFVDYKNNQRKVESTPQQFQERQRKPQMKSIINNQSFIDRLTNDMFEFQEEIRKQNQEISNARNCVISRIRYIVNVYCQANIKLFGSCLTGVELVDSDLDIAVVGLEMQQKNQVFLYMDNIFAGFSWVISKKAILTASVPVLKLEIDPSIECGQTNVNLLPGEKSKNINLIIVLKARIIQVDITVETLEPNQHLGNMSTSYVQHWNMVPGFQQITILIKFLIKRLGFNDYYIGGISSFCLYVMVIAIFVTSNQPYIPGQILMNFLDRYGNNFQLSKEGVNLNKNGFIQIDESPINPPLTVYSPITNTIISYKSTMAPQILEQFQKLFLWLQNAQKKQEKNLFTQYMRLIN